MLSGWAVRGEDEEGSGAQGISAPGLASGQVRGCSHQLGISVVGLLRLGGSQLCNPPILLSARTLLLGRAAEISCRARRATPAIWCRPRISQLVWKPPFCSTWSTGMVGGRGTGTSTRPSLCSAAWWWAANSAGLLASSRVANCCPPCLL